MTNEKGRGDLDAILPPELQGELEEAPDPADFVEPEDTLELKRAAGTRRRKHA